MVPLGAALLAVCVGAAAWIPAADASTDYTWDGGDASSALWGTADNWGGDAAPSGSVGTLSFPALTSAACTAATPTAVCYSSDNDVAGLSAAALSIDDGEPYSISGDAITLGSGGLTAAPSANDPVDGEPPSIDLPITLGADQSWTITGGSDNQQLSLGDPVTGSAYTLGIALNDYTFLNLAGDNEVGAVTVTSSGDPGTLVLGQSGGAGMLNATDGNEIDLEDGTGFVAWPGETGPLVETGGMIQIGEGQALAGGSLLTVEGAASLDGASMLMFVNDATGDTAGTDYSQLSATGNITLLNSPSLDLANFGGSCPTLSVGDVYTLLQSTGGTISGTFANTPNGTDVTLQCNGGTPPTLEINYTSTTVTATVVSGGSGGGTPTPTTVGLASDPTDPVTNQRVTLTATVAPASATPTGTVEFLNGTDPIAGCTAQPVSETGSTYTATCETSFSAATSPEHLSATFSPSDPASLAGSTGGTTLSVGRATTSTGLALSRTTASAGQSVTYTATVNTADTGAATPTGAVTFRDNGKAIGSCRSRPLSGGRATCTTSYTAAGSHTITATYAGDVNFAGSSAGPHKLTVSTRPTTSQVKAALDAALGAISGKSATIPAILEAGGYKLTFSAPSAGRLTIDWYAMSTPGAKLRSARGTGKPELVADLSTTFHRAGRASVEIKLTAAGRTLLKHANKVTVTQDDSFTPTGGATVKLSRTLTLRR